MVGRALSNSDDCSYHSALVSRYGIVEAKLGYLREWSWALQLELCGVAIGGARKSVKLFGR